jgi:adenylate cyclase
VRRAGARIRTTAQLIDAVSGNHIWAERYDRQLANIFDVQDEITGAIVAMTEIEMRDAEVARAGGRPLKNYDAWARYHLGMNQFYRTTHDGNVGTRRSLDAGIAADPDFALAYAGLALTCLFDINMGFVSDTQNASDRGLEMARKALVLDKREAYAHMLSGRLLGMRGESDLAIGVLQKALALNPNLALAHYNIGQMQNWIGNLTAPLGHVAMAIRLRPHDPMVWTFHMLKRVCLRLRHRFNKAICSARDRYAKGPRSCGRTSYKRRPIWQPGVSTKRALHWPTPTGCGRISRSCIFARCYRISMPITWKYC